MENKTIKEICKIYTDAVQDLVGKKINIGKEMHKMVNDRIKDIYKLLNYNVWEVIYDNNSNRRILDLNVKIKDDLRYKTDRVGTIKKIQFIPHEDIRYLDNVDDMTIANIFENKRKRDLKDDIKYYKCYIEELKNKLKETKQLLIEMKKEYLEKYGEEI